MHEGNEPVAGAGPVAGVSTVQGYPPPAAIPVAPWYAAVRPGPGDVPAAARLVLGLLLAGIPVGLAWLGLAPRREFLVAEQGAFAVENDSEAAVAGDGWFLLLTVAVAIGAAVVAWRWRRHRGPVMPVALAVGTALTGVVAWLTGSVLGPGPTPSELAEIGGIVRSPLELRAYGVLVVAPFVAVVGYLVAACFTPGDDLDRTDSVRGVADHQLGQRDGYGVQPPEEGGLPPQQPDLHPQPLQGRGLDQ